MAGRDNVRSPGDMRATMSRSAGWALAQSIIDPPPRRASGFLSSDFFTWLCQYLKVAFSPRHEFLTYKGAPSSGPGRFELAEQCRVALAGDWGSGTESAYRVMDEIRFRQKPDVTIHLGDIYYSGQVEEVMGYFLGPDDWYRAGRSFALSGNHEMYSGGGGYFDHVLPALGQEASYFCLQNEHWRFVGVDTGYYAKVFPFLELFMSTRLHDENLKWMREVVFADPRDRRPVILLSHHQWFSAFDRGYARVGAQLAPFLRDVALWFWGHEHRFAGYAAYAAAGTTKVRARCLGHGGMPVELTPRRQETVPLVFVDNRIAYEEGGEAIGFCGNALLELDGASLVIRYYDERGLMLLEEGWQSGGRAGGARGRVLSASPELTWVRDREELVR